MTASIFRHLVAQMIITAIYFLNVCIDDKKTLTCFSLFFLYLFIFLMNYLFWAC